MTASKPRKHRVFLHQRPGHDDLVRRHGSTLGRRTDSHQESETAAALAFASGTAVAGCTKVPPRGVEQPPDSGRETQNPPAPGTESGTPAADPLPELLALVVELRPEAAALLLTLARRLAAHPQS